MSQFTFMHISLIFDLWGWHLCYLYKHIYKSFSTPSTMHEDVWTGEGGVKPLPLLPLQHVQHLPPRNGVHFTLYLMHGSKIFPFFPPSQFTISRQIWNWQDTCAYLGGETNHNVFPKNDVKFKTIAISLCHILLPSSCWAPGRTRRIFWLYWFFFFFFEGVIDQHPYSSIIARSSLFRENAS